jgi:hypothetical protein
MGSRWAFGLPSSFAATSSLAANVATMRGWRCPGRARSAPERRNGLLCGEELCDYFRADLLSRGFRQRRNSPAPRTSPVVHQNGRHLAAKHDGSGDPPIAAFRPVSAALAGGSPLTVQHSTLLRRARAAPIWTARRKRRTPHAHAARPCPSMPCPRTSGRAGPR